MIANSSIINLRIAVATCLIFASNVGFRPLCAQVTSPARASATLPPALSYADLADLVTAAPLIIKAQVTDSIVLPPTQQPTGLRGRRAYVEARVTALIRGESGLSPAVSYLYDIPLDARGRPAKLRKRQVLLFARAGTRPGQIQLVAPDAQIDWNPEVESRVRAIAAEVLGTAPPPRITGVGDAFHVAGTVAGEGETQIFLRTETGEPVSLSIVRRPGQEPRWAVALGEIVDEAAAAPTPGSLLWYRLACGLPPSMPVASVRTLSARDAEVARQDYALVLAGLGPCGRTRPAS